MRTRTRTTIQSLTLAVSMAALSSTASVAQPASEIAFDVENAPTDHVGSAEPLLRPEHARLTRYGDRIAVEISMPTPVPGTYVYPADVPPTRRASPEAFTLWAFVFNRPEACVGSTEPPRCGPEDFSQAARAGIYGVAGHVTSVDHSGGAFELDRASGGQIVLKGEIAIGDPQRMDMPPGVPTYPLEDPLAAEVHLAIAPHGQVEPATIATELYEPAGDPACGCWWVAFFVPGGASRGE